MGTKLYLIMGINTAKKCPGLLLEFYFISCWLPFIIKSNKLTTDYICIVGICSQLMYSPIVGWTAECAETTNSIIFAVFRAARKGSLGLLANGSICFLFRRIQ